MLRSVAAYVEKSWRLKPPARAADAAPVKRIAASLARARENSPATVRVLCGLAGLLVGALMAFGALVAGVVVVAVAIGLYVGRGNNTDAEPELAAELEETRRR